MSNYSIVKIGKLCWDRHKGRAPLSYLCDLSSAQSSTLNVVGAHWILGSEWAERSTAEAWFSVLQLWTAPTACHRAHACRSHEDFHRASAGKDFFPPSSTSCVQALGPFRWASHPRPCDRLSEWLEDWPWGLTVSPLCPHPPPWACRSQCQRQGEEADWCTLTDAVATSQLCPKSSAPGPGSEWLHVIWSTEISGTCLPIWQ